MELKVNIPQQQIDQFKQDLDNKLQVAAIKALEYAIEKTPAAGETEYSTGQLRQSLRMQKTGDLEYTIFCPAEYGIFVEFGTGPKGAATGRIVDFPDDPQPTISYHSGEVLVTRAAGRILDTPYVRHTQGMEAQPFMRPALLEGLKWFNRLLEE